MLIFGATVALLSAGPVVETDGPGIGGVLGIMTTMIGTGALKFSR
jgi:hypothetical protein